MSDDLTPKQRIFVTEYLKDFNATQSAIKAGYKEDNAYATGFENLRKPKIKEYIRKELDEIIGTKKDILEKQIIDTYYKRAFYDLAQFTDSEGSVSIDLIRDAGYGCIIDGVKKAKIVTVGDNFEKVEPVVYDLANRDKALEQLTKYMQLITDKQEIDITTKVVLTQEDAGLL